MRTTRSTGAVCALVILAACGGDNLAQNDALSPMLNRDVAQVAADGAAEDVELMGGPGGLLGFAFAAPQAPADERRHLCDSKTREGLTVTRTCVFKDAGGTVQSAYDPITTATAEIRVTVEGSVVRENWEAEISRVRELVATGLEGTETARTWNGTGQGDVTRSRHREGQETRSYNAVYTTTITNVVVPVPRTEDSWPMSGTITKNAQLTVIGGPNDGRVVERLVTIAFNGTQFVPITINGTSYTFDLKTRRIVREG
jgi:hypothetical protein